MENLPAITAFFGWSTVVNLGIYSLTALTLMGFKEPVKAIHTRLTAVPAAKLDELYFNYLGNFKIAIIFLNITPYAALKLMG